MRSIRPVLFLLPLLFPTTGPAAECEPLRWGNRTAVTALAADGRFLWLGGTTALEGWDTSDPLRPRRVLREATGAVDAIAVIDGGAVALAQNRLISFTRQGRVADLAIDAQIIAAHDDHVVTSDGETVSLWRMESGLPTLVARASGSSGILALAFDGDTIVAARGSRGISAWDRAGTALVRPRSGAVAANDLVIEGGVGWAAAGASGLISFDLATLTPRAGGAVDSGRGDFASIDAQGARLVVGDASGFVRTYARDGANATPLSASPFPLTHLALGDGVMFLAGTSRSRFGEPLPDSHRVVIVDADDMRVLGSIDGGSVSLNGAAPHRNLIYVADAPLLRTFEIRNGSFVEIASTEYGDASDRVRIENGYAIVYGRGDAHLISLADPRAPRYLGVFRGLGSSPNDVAMAGELLLEVNRGSGFHILDISDPERPGQIGGMINDGYGQHHRIAAIAGAAYSAADAVVKVIDLRDLSLMADPWTSTYVTTLPHGGVRDLDTIPGEVPLLVIADGRELVVYSLEDPLSPRLRSTTDIGLIRAMRRVDGARAVVIATTEGRIHEVLLASPDEPVVELIAEDIPAIDVRADADRIVASTGASVVILSREGPHALVPSLEAERAADGLILVRWPGRAEWVVELSAQEDFRDASVFGIGGESAAIGGDLDARWVRANVPGCTAFSAVASIEAASDGVIPLGRRVRLAGSPDTEVSRELTIANMSSSGRDVVLSHPTAILLSKEQFTLAAGERTTIEIRARIPSAREEHVVTMGDRTVTVVLDPLMSRSASLDPQSDLLVPGVGNTAGARGTRWRSNLDLACVSPDPCSATLSWIREENVRQLDLELEAGEAIVLEDAATLLGVAGTGAIAVRQHSGTLEIGAVTWNDGSGGFYGQRIEAIALDAVRRTPRWSLPAVTSSDGFRTNLGLAAPIHSTTAHVGLRDADGSLLWEFDLALPAGAVRSIPVEIAGSNMAISVEGDGVVVWGSRIDQQTGDATFVAATPVQSGPERLTPHGWRYRIDLAGRTPGAGGAMWETDLTLTNPGELETTVRAVWLPRDGAAEEETFTIAPRGSTGRLEDLLPPEGLGSIIVESNAPLVPWGRAWIRTGDGTFGQFVPAAAEPGSLPVARATAPRSVIFPASDNESFRTNLAISERDGVETRATIEVRAGDGTLLTVRGEEIEPWRTLLLTSALRRWGVEGPARQIRVRSNGSVRSLASIVANATGDGVTIAVD